MEKRTFVAREQQLQQLKEKLTLVLKGQGQVGFVSGEAGSGKTALIHHFVAQAQDKYPDLLVTLGNCNARTGIGDPYLPFREALELLVGSIGGEAASEAITEENGKRIKHFMADSGRILLEVAPDLIGSFIPGGVILSALGKALAVKTGIADKLDHLRKQEENISAIGQGLSDQNQVFQQYTEYVQAIAKEHPLMIVIDDLHWVDAASASLLFHLSRRNEDHPIFIIGTYRSTEVLAGKRNGSHPFASVLTDLKRYFGEISINLDKLDETEEKSFVDQFIDSEPNQLGEEFRNKLLKLTNGHPLFTVELLRHLQDTGSLIKNESGQWIEGKELDWRELPAKVDGVIAGRIQRLDAESQEILSAASVQGAEFIAEIVARVLSLEDKQVIKILSGDLSKKHQIVHLQLVKKSDGQQVAAYQFEHSLFQQYLLNDIDDAQKAILHEDTGNELNKLYGDEDDEIAPQLAFHYTQSGDREKAVKYLIKAGDEARHLYASQEAAEYYRQAIDFLIEEGNFDLASRTMMKQALASQNAFDFATARKTYDEAFTLRRKADAQLPEKLPPSTRPCRMVWGSPLALDPGKIGDVSSSFYIEWLFSGLVDLSPNLNVIPDVAERWEISDDGQRYQFHLRQDVVWTDGTPVTAHDFVYALQRLFDPENSKSNLAGVFSVIKGAPTTAASVKSNRDKLAVRAIDDYLLEIELAQPVAYFLQLMSQANAFPVPSHKVIAEKEKWTDPENIVTNGPFTLTDYLPNKRILLQKYQQYHRPFGGNLDSIEVLFYSPENDSFYEKDYLNGEIDILRISSDYRRRLARKFGEELHKFPTLGLNFLSFNTRISPFNDLRVRSAFCLATDHEAVVAKGLQDSSIPAKGGMIPPSMPGHVREIGLGFDISKAQEYLGEAGYPGGKGFPKIEFIFPDTRGTKGGEFVCDQWQEYLNVNVKPKPLPSADYYIAYNEHLSPIIFGAWAADFADPDSFLLSSWWIKATGWNNSEYIQLVEKAREEIDQSKRLELYRRAELIIAAEVPVSPISYNVFDVFIKPWLKRFVLSPMSDIFLQDLVLDLYGIN